MFSVDLKLLRGGQLFCDGREEKLGVGSITPTAREEEACCETSFVAELSGNGASNSRLSGASHAI